MFFFLSDVARDRRVKRGSKDFFKKFLHFLDKK